MTFKLKEFDPDEIIAGTKVIWQTVSKKNSDIADCKEVVYLTELDRANEDGTLFAAQIITGEFIGIFDNDGYFLDTEGSRVSTSRLWLAPTLQTMYVCVYEYENGNHYTRRVMMRGSEQHIRDYFMTHKDSKQLGEIAKIEWAE